MKENCLLKIITNQNIEGVKDELELTTLASFSGSDDDYYLSYTEKTAEHEDFNTTLHVEDGKRITILRDGSYDSHMIIEKDVRHISQLLTEYGVLSLGTSALSINSNVKQGNGKLHFKYETDIDMKPLGVIEFNITMKPRKSALI